MKLISGILIVMAIMVLNTSCFLQRKVTVQYLETGMDTGKLKKIQVPEPIIQKGDLLSILVFSADSKASLPFNQPVVSTGNSSVEVGNRSSNESVAQTVSGYLVDQNGNIQFPVLGLLKVEGLTRNAVKELLDSKLKGTLLTDPYYIIRFVNFKITVMGEVSHAGSFSIPAEKVNILEAIALAGEMTIWGRRDNVTIIRETNGNREVAQLDLTKSSIFDSPYYYLQQNDIILVGEKKNKEIANDQVTQRNVTIVTSVISSIAIVITAISALTR